MTRGVDESINPHAAGVIPTRWGLALALAAAGLVMLVLNGNLLAMLLVAGLAGLVGLIAAFRCPELLPAGLLLVAPFNYGFGLGGAVVKVSELIVVAMLALILIHLVAGDAELYRRLRRAGVPLVTAGLLALMAVLTALPHPNAGNVRYEVQNAIAFAFTLLFFRRAWWPRLILAALAVLLAESAAALIIKFVLGKSGISLFDVGGGIKSIQFSASDLEALAGGRFRLAGTFGHKNLLAAFYILLVPMAALDALKRGRVAGLLIVISALVTLALTDSMSAWGALVLVVIVALLHLRRFDYWAVATLLALPLAGLALYRFGDSVFMRIGQILDGREGWGTVSSRHEIFTIGLRLIDEHPWLGIGRNNYLAYGKTFYGHAHNVFLMKIIEMGIPAGIIFAVFIITVMGRIWRTILCEAGRLGRDRQYFLTLGAWLGCLGFLGMNLVDYNYSHFALGPIFMTLLGLQLAIARNLEAKETAPRSAADTTPACAASEPQP